MVGLCCQPYRYSCLDWKSRWSLSCQFAIGFIHARSVLPTLTLDLAVSSAYVASGVPCNLLHTRLDSSAYIHCRLGCQLVIGFIFAWLALPTFTVDLAVGLGVHRFCSLLHCPLQPLQNTQVIDLNQWWKSYRNQLEMIRLIIMAKPEWNQNCEF